MNKQPDFNEKSYQWQRKLEDLLCDITKDKNHNGESYLVDVTPLMLEFDKILDCSALAHGQQKLKRFDVFSA